MKYCLDQKPFWPLLERKKKIKQFWFQIFCLAIVLWCTRKDCANFHQKLYIFLGSRREIRQLFGIGLLKLKYTWSAETCHFSKIAKSAKSLHPIIYWCAALPASKPLNILRYHHPFQEQSYCTEHYMYVQYTSPFLSEPICEIVFRLFYPCRDKVTTYTYMTLNVFFLSLFY